jgi:hypothetical protein
MMLQFLGNSRQRRLGAAEDDVFQNSLLVGTTLILEFLDNYC